MSSTAEAALASWRDTATTRAILEFVAAATREGDEGWIPPPERVAVFDNDGTLWTEKRMPVQLDFIVRGFAAAAQRDPALRARQPYKARAPVSRMRLRAHDRANAPPRGQRLPHLHRVGRRPRLHAPGR